MPDDRLRIDPATPADVPIVLELIRALAEYEHEPNAVHATELDIHEALFGPRPAAEAALARYDGAVAGLAFWFQNFSTWSGKPGLWLEDLFVRPEYRRKGLGRALFAHLARIARDRGYERIEWSVLDWNQPARDFYRRIGAETMDDWTNHRLEASAFDRLAASEA